MLNLSTLRTPGVYIDEVPKFPPSIAAVETAIPAFIGYTEKKFEEQTIPFLPIEVESMIDFERKFGLGPKVNFSQINIDENNAIKEAKTNSPFYLYDSLRMYFSNGGGRCFIISIGKYSEYNAGTIKTNIEKAIDSIKLVDDPTLIVIPDGISMNAVDLGAVHKKALEICSDFNNLVGKFRFLIADVKISNPDSETYNNADIVNFKNGIGMSSLQFAGAYYPYLKVTLPRQIKYRDVRGKVRKLGVLVNWSDYAADNTTKDLLAALDSIIKGSELMESALNGWLSAENVDSLRAIYDKKRKDFYDAIESINGNFANITAIRDSYRLFWSFIYDVAYKLLDQFAKETTSPLITGTANTETILTQLRTKITNELAVAPNSFSELLRVDVLSQQNNIIKGTTAIHNLAGSGRTWAYSGFTGAITTGMGLAANTAGLTIGDASANDDTGRSIAVSNMTEIIEKKGLDIFNGLATLVNSVFSDNKNFENSFETNVLQQIPVLGSLLTNLKTQKFLLPPSGAIAGIYAKTDSSRGVWKAPANETLNNVYAPSVKIEKETNDRLNVDTSFGKSINVIKSFTGKGVLVWGARTLAGNDNEWRYVSVRRFFSMVEESCKKTTEQFVFEPNDANTWVKVQAMIENFLTTLWRQGALQGAIPEHAFYVAVGLGKTMTALDILEGRMIVEIGMAAVRPAEFIVLRFSHKMPES
ncbi:MAG: phage tail sheath C-terminal domain-containing protein [Spirosomataceae bacterium]